MRVLAIVPTYNEAENLPTLAAGLLGLVPPIEVLVVDDASPDGTADIAAGIAEREPRLHVMRRPGPRGWVLSAKDALRWALEKGFEVVVFVDADLSHDPAVIPVMLGRIAEGVDLVIGSRYIPGGELSVDWGPWRTAVSKMGSAYARLAVGTHVRDCTSGYRCYTRSTVEILDIENVQSEGYSFQIETLDRLTRLGARIEEVPIVYVDRRAGVSKISRGIIFEALFRTTGIGLRRIVGR